MNLKWRTNKDFSAEALFLGTSALALAIARGYPFGTTLRF